MGGRAPARRVTLVAGRVILSHAHCEPRLAGSGLREKAAWKLRAYQELTVSTSGDEPIVPITVKLVSPELEFSHLLVGNLEAGWIGIGVEFALHRQARRRCGGSNEVDDDFMTDQRLASPILADEGKQSVFDLVPLAGAGREVSHRDFKSCFIG